MNYVSDMKGRPKVSIHNRRPDIPGPVMWLRSDDGPESANMNSKPKVDEGPIPSGEVITVGYIM